MNSAFDTNLLVMKKEKPFPQTPATTEKKIITIMKELEGRELFPEKNERARKTLKK